MAKRRGLVLVTVAAALVLVLAVWGAAAAQETPAPFLGIGIVPADKGVEVSEVLPGSPADEAGLQPGDIITAIDGTAVTFDSAGSALREYAVGDTVQLDVLRGGETLQLSATLAPLPVVEAGVVIGGPGMRPMLGVRLENTDGGPAVREVLPGSPAETAGLLVGDIITRVGDTEVTTGRDVTRALRGASVGDTVTLEVLRGAETLTLDVTLEAMPLIPGMGMRGDGILYNGLNQSWEILGLSAGTPLYEAGLRAGDVITQFDGQQYDPVALRDYLASIGNDATVTLTVERGGETQEIEVPASALFGFSRFDFRPGMGEGPGRGDGRGGFGMPHVGMMPMINGYLGVEFVSLNAEVAAEQGVEVTEGALVVAIIPESPAAQAGLQENDIITAVNGEAVNAEITLRDRLFAYEAGDPVKLTVLRGSEVVEVEVELGEPAWFGHGEGMPFEFVPQPEVPQPPAAQPNI